MLGDTALFSGKASSKGLAKGLGKGKLKGFPGQLALEDDKLPPKSESQLAQDALNKAKKNQGPCLWNNCKH